MRTKAKSDFIFEDHTVPRENLVLVVYSTDPLTLDVWMPRAVTDRLTHEQREELVEVIADFVRNVPVRRN